MAETLCKKPIYEPKGAAKEYGDLALNIYMGCPHRCFYCFAPRVLHREKEQFHSVVQPRAGIVEATRQQVERENITGKLIHLCFTCDPYPRGCDSSATREIIKILKTHGNHVQILTKGDGSRDFDLLDGDDWYGVTLDGSEKIHVFDDHLIDLYTAKIEGINTWVSFEPVVDAKNVLRMIEATSDAADRIKIGKLNYYPSSIDWADFGRKAEALCNKLGLDYYIKESLRQEMMKRP